MVLWRLDGMECDLWIGCKNAIFFLQFNMRRDLRSFCFNDRVPEPLLPRRWDMALHRVDSLERILRQCISYQIGKLHCNMRWHLRCCKLDDGEPRYMLPCGWHLVVWRVVAMEFELWKRNAIAGR